MDPPFNSNANYAAPIGSEAAGAAFKNTWSLADVDVAWMNLIASKHPALYRVLLAAMTDSDKAYLVYMAARLLECRRVLKPDGSLYLHCDPTMGHYLKLLMDAIFGKSHFRNEITWQRTNAHNDPKRYGNVADIILLYAGPGHIWNPQYQTYSETQQGRFRHMSSDGRLYKLDDLTAPRHGSTSGQFVWRGAMPGAGAAGPTPSTS